MGDGCQQSHAEMDCRVRVHAFRCRPGFLVPVERAEVAAVILQALQMCVLCRASTAQVTRYNSCGSVDRRAVDSWSLILFVLL
jgi:hypothetical protein